MAIPQDAVPKVILHYEGAVLTKMASGKPASICCCDSSGPTAESRRRQQLHFILCKGAKIIKHLLDVHISILHHTVEITTVEHRNAQTSGLGVVIPSMGMSRE